MSKKKRSKKKKGKYSKVVVGLILLISILFVTAILTIFYTTGLEPTTLIKYFFVFVIGELWLVAGIKKKKIRQEDDMRGVDETYENEDRMEA